MDIQIIMAVLVSVVVSASITLLISRYYFQKLLKQLSESGGAMPQAVASNKAALSEPTNRAGVGQILKKPVLAVYSQLRRVTTVVRQSRLWQSVPGASGWVLSFKSWGFAVLGRIPVPPKVASGVAGFSQKPYFRTALIATTVVLVMGTLVPVAAIAAGSWINLGSNGEHIYYTGGNVGIGNFSSTNHPESSIQVAGTIADAPITDGAHLGMSGSYAAMQLYGSSGGFIDFSSVSGQDVEYRIIDDGNLRIGATTGPTAIQINADNQVGIGTNNPGSHNDVADDLVVGSGMENNGLTVFAANNGTIHFSDAAGYPEGAVVYNHDANAMFLSTNGAEKVRIDSAGNVGIGTDSPVVTLDVNGTSEIGSDTNAVALGDVGGVTTMWSWNRNGNAHTPLSIRTSPDVGQLYLNTDGNIGIGTTTPDAKLDVEGHTLVDLLTVDSDRVDSTNRFFRVSSYGSDGVIRVNPGTESTIYVNREVGAGVKKDFHILDGDVAPVFSTIGASGNVGIGTYSPGYKLEVNDDAVNVAIQVHNTQADSQAGLRLANDAREWLIQTQGNDGDKLYFYDITGAATRMVIDTLGNIGIGTSTPDAKLDVEGHTLVDLLTVDSDRVDSANRFFRVSSYGVDGTIRVNPGTGSTIYVNREVGVKKDFYILDGDTAPVFSAIGASGNVGIGTYTPDANAKLDVAGNIKLNGNITSDGDICIGVCD